MQEVLDDNITVIKLCSLRTGVLLRSPIFDAGSNPPLLLLVNGTMLTESLLGLLEKRGIHEVRISKGEIARLVNLGTPTAKNASLVNPLKQSKKVVVSANKKNDSSKNNQTAQPVAKTSFEQVLKLKSNSFFYQLQQQTAKPIDREIVCFAKERRELACQKIDSVYQDFAQGNTKSTKFLESMTTDTLIDIAKDLDIFLAISLNPLEKGYPSRHSLQMASMAMAIGTVHGLNREELIELGIGCLIHDAGMLHLRDKTYDSSQEFGMHEHLSITKHPILTQQLLQSCKDVPKSSLLVSYQMHERGDGSGYPRGRYGTQIHYLAKIGMVADVYVALTSERPHRPAYHPYHAIEQILHQTNQNKLDPSVVRSLLHTISLFPINSYVELSDNSPARVIRANRLDFTKPVVEVWNWKDLEAMPLQINLQEQKDLKVIRPIEEFPLKSEAMG